jgi:hypothetical protein
MARDQLTTRAAQRLRHKFPGGNQTRRQRRLVFFQRRRLRPGVACQLDYPVMNDPRPAMRAALDQQSELRAGLQPCQYHLSRRPGMETPARNGRSIRPKQPPCAASDRPCRSAIFRRASDGWIFIKESRANSRSPQTVIRPSPYPFYDRWSDSFNLSQEFVIVNQARRWRIGLVDGPDAAQEPALEIRRGQHR